MASGLAFIELTDPNGIVTQITAVPAAESDAAELVSRRFRFRNQRGQDVKVYVSSVVLEISKPEGLGNASLWVGYADRIKEPAQWLGPYSLAGSDEQIPVDRSMRFLLIRLIDTSPREIWKFTGIDVYGRIVGGAPGV